MFLHFPPSHYLHILSIICLTSDINWHSPLWFWGFIEKSLGGLFSWRKSWPTWLGKVRAQVVLGATAARGAGPLQQFTANDFLLLASPSKCELPRRENLSVAAWIRGLHLELVSSGQEQGLGALISSSGIKDRFTERRVTVSGQPSLGVSAIIVHISFPRKEMRNSTQLKDLHTRAHTHSKENLCSFCFG